MALKVPFFNAYENVAGFVGKCGKNVAIKKPLLQVADLYKEFWRRWRQLNSKPNPFILNIILQI